MYVLNMYVQRVKYCVHAHGSTFFVKLAEIQTVVNRSATHE
jgi:hypothetical protein